MVVTGPPFRAVDPPESVVRLVSAAVPPTAPPNVVTPDVLTVSAKAPSTVEPRVIAPPPVEVSVAAAPSVTASP